MYVKQLSEDEEKALMARRDKITNLQDMGVCFSCHNFKVGNIFPDEGLIIY